MHPPVLRTIIAMMSATSLSLQPLLPNRDRGCEPPAHPTMRAVLVRSLLAPLMLAALISGGMASAQGSSLKDIAYGQDRLQRLSFWGAASCRPPR